MEPGSRVHGSSVPDNFWQDLLHLVRNEAKPAQHALTMQRFLALGHRLGQA